MPDLFRDQPRVRIAIGAAFVVLVWTLYGVRMIFGVGPMHDDAGNQAPGTHYLAAALIVTGMVVVWIAVQEIVRRRQK